MGQSLTRLVLLATLTSIASALQGLSRDRFLPYTTRAGAKFAPELSPRQTVAILKEFMAANRA